VIVVVTGTGTEVGKTWFTAATITVVRASGRAVAARKPVQSFDPNDTSPTDAEVLARATGEAPETVCPRHRWLGLAVAPPMAAVALGLEPFTIAELAAEVRAGAPAGADRAARHHGDDRATGDDTRGAAARGLDGRVVGDTLGAVIVTDAKTESAAIFG